VGKKRKSLREDAGGEDCGDQVPITSEQRKGNIFGKIAKARETIIVVKQCWAHPRKKLGRLRLKPRKQSDASDLAGKVMTENGLFPKNQTGKERGSSRKLIRNYAPSSDNSDWERGAHRATHQGVKQPEKT